MIPRTLHDYLLHAATHFPIVACLGPRQSGKTTLVRSAFEELPYSSMENLDTREFAESDPRGFFASYPHGAILDEIQRVPSLLSYLQGVVDNDTAIPHSKRFVLTGSHNILLHQALTQSLAGRVALTTLLPFGIEEIASQAGIAAELWRNNTNEHYEILLWSGMYPRVIARKIPPTEWLPNYITTYIERDVRLIQSITDLSTFTLFVQMCAGRVGQMLNFSAMANECGISANTAKSWFSLLEASYIVFRVQPYHQNFNKRLVKSPKLYFYDTGLACSLLGIQSPEQIPSHFARGALFENMIIADVKKYFLHRGQRAALSFWRDNNGREIDLIVEHQAASRGLQRTAIEVKSARTITSEMFDGLRAWQTMSGDTAEHSVLVYGGKEQQIRTTARVVGWSDAAKNIAKNIAQ